MAQLWNDKHAPLSLDTFCGNFDAVEEGRHWAMEADREKSVKPLLVHGPCGVGKTAFVHALAKERGWSLVETNAGDLRDAASLENVYSASGASAGLFGKPVLFIDEVDAAADRGEFPTLERLVKEARAPVILAANDVWHPKLAGLRFACRLVQFKRINAQTLKKRLREIAAAESVSDELVDRVGSLASGDLRSAINDLQALTGVTGEDLKPFEKGLADDESPLTRFIGRDRDEDLFNAVRKAFKSGSYTRAMEAGESLNTVEFDLFLRWLEHNLPLEYERADEVAEGFHWLSRADVFQGRIRRRQHWGFLRYVRALALGGVSSSKHEVYHKFVKYEFPAVIKEMGRTRAVRDERLKTARLAAGRMHVSMEDARDALARLAGVPGASAYFALGEEEGKPVTRRKRG